MHKIDETRSSSVMVRSGAFLRNMCVSLVHFLLYFVVFVASLMMEEEEEEEEQK